MCTLDSRESSRTIVILFFRVVITDGRPQRYIEGIRSNLSNSTQMVVCILPNKNKGIYDAVKKYLTLDNPGMKCIAFICGFDLLS